MLSADEILSYRDANWSLARDAARLLARSDVSERYLVLLLLDLPEETPTEGQTSLHRLLEGINFIAPSMPFPKIAGDRGCMVRLWSLS